MEPNQLLYLSQNDVVAVGLTMAEIIDALEVAFREKGKGLTEVPPKPGGWRQLYPCHAGLHSGPKSSRCQMGKWISGKLSTGIALYHRPSYSQ